MVTKRQQTTLAKLKAAATAAHEKYVAYRTKIEEKCMHPLLVEQSYSHEDTLGNYTSRSSLTINCALCAQRLCSADGHEREVRAARAPFRGRVVYPIGSVTFNRRYDKKRSIRDEVMLRCPQSEADARKLLDELCGVGNWSLT